MKKAISAALLIAGILLLYFGYQEYNSLSSNINETFTGSPSNEALWMLIGGAAASVASLVGLVRGK
jgi:hypothetical protein